MRRRAGPNSLDQSRKDGWFDLDGEYSKLLAVMGDLSGLDVPRDTKDIQKRLVILSRSRNPEIAEDARSLLVAASDGHWFEGSIPSYAELENIAHRSVAYYLSWRRRKRFVKVILVLLAIALVGLAYLIVIGWRSTLLN